MVSKTKCDALNFHTSIPTTTQSQIMTNYYPEAITLPNEADMQQIKMSARYEYSNAHS